MASVFNTSTDLGQQLAQIANLLQRNPEMHLPTLIQGNAGISLFFAYLAQYDSADIHLENCITHLEQAIDSVANTDQTPFLATGFTGLSWLIAHLVRLGVLDAEAANLLDDIRPIIVSSAVEGLMSIPYDLLYGYIGASVFFNEDSSVDFDEAQRILLERCSCTALKVDEGIAWPNSLDTVDPPFNLGLAHGMPGIIVWLLQLQCQGISTVNLVRPAINYVLAQEKPAGNSVFPTSIGGANSLPKSRLAWCHGDLGIALMLILAGQVLEDDNYLKKGIMLAYQAAERDIEQAGVQIIDGQPDMGFCHGTSGIAFLFWKMYLLTKDEILGARAKYWLQLTTQHLDSHLSSLMKNFSIKKFNGIDPDLENRYGLLEGIAGIGLVLLAFANPTRTDWARLMLMDVK